MSGSGGRRSDRAGRGRRAGVGSAALAVASLALGLAACRIEVEEDQELGVEPYVLRMLEESAAAWNRGDLEGFLSDYADAPSTTYVGSRGLVTGFDGIRAVYAPAFAPGAARDSLRFEDVRVRSLPPLAAIVTARWVLHDGDTVTASGPTTLVVRRLGSGWRIVHDHSSSDPAAPVEGG